MLVLHVTYEDGTQNYYREIDEERLTTLLHATSCHSRVKTSTFQLAT